MNRLKRVLNILAVFLAGLWLTGPPTWAGVSNLDALVASDSLNAPVVTATTTLNAAAIDATTAPQVNGVATIFYTTLTLDSLGFDADAVGAIWTPDVDGTIKSLQVRVRSMLDADSILADTCNVWLTSRGADADSLHTDTLYLGQGSSKYKYDGSMKAATDSTGPNFTAAQPCTTWIDDGGKDGSGDGKHAKSAEIIIGWKPR